jgi:hypothetical protein
MELIHLPKMMKIRQLYDSAYIEDIPNHILRQMEENLSTRSSTAERGLPSPSAAGVSPTWT